MKIPYYHCKWGMIEYIKASVFRALTWGATVYVESAWRNNVKSTMFFGILSFKVEHGTIICLSISFSLSLQVLDNSPSHVSSRPYKNESF